ncbi:MAG: glycosyltransferase [Proteobacteria bacterium]|nr:glycosyltransferase [Pseudomonadota bacterium]
MSADNSTVARSGPLLSIVIVNWNGERFLAPLFESITEQSFKEFEILFVDNGSKDGSVEFVRSDYPAFTIIENSENRGFAEANNQGIERATGEFILTLNNDTVLEPLFLQSLMEAATSPDASKERTGMWAPKILSLSLSKASPDMIDSVGGLLLYPNGIGRGRGRMDSDSGQFDSLTEVLMPSACAGLYRRAMLDEIGLFDSDFFAYCEDTDLGLRARIAGWGALSVPGAVVRHYYSGTSGSHTPFKAYLVERNHLWVAMKLFPFSSLLLFPFYEALRYLVQAKGVTSGVGASAKLADELSFVGLIRIVLRAYAGAFIKLPSVLAKRRAVYKSARIPARQFKRLLRRYSITARELALKD